MSEFLRESFSSEFQESSVHPPLSSALFGSSESSLLVTLGDRHHLDGSVVIVGTKTAREFLWVARVKLVSGFGRFTVTECRRISP